ncbi:MAG: transposase [Pseudomonadota bacterium]
MSKDGDPLEVLEAAVNFEHFRPWLVEGLGYGDGSKGGRPPFDPVSMFKALILQAQHNLSDARMEFMIRNRLSWMRFLGFDLGAPTPDENTIRHFRKRLTETGTLKRVMKAFDWQLKSERANATGPRETANGVHPHGRADRRCIARAGAQAAQYRGRE